MFKRLSYIIMEREYPARDRTAGSVRGSGWSGQKEG